MRAISLRREERLKLPDAIIYATALELGVEPWTNDARLAHARYLAKYLSEERPPCLKRWRLWAAFGEGWEPTKVKDLMKESLFSTVYRACKEWQGWTGRGDFFERLDFVRRMVFMTI